MANLSHITRCGLPGIERVPFGMHWPRPTASGLAVRHAVIAVPRRDFLESRPIRLSTELIYELTCAATAMRCKRKTFHFF
jgi:hypothetical protein